MPDDLERFAAELDALNAVPAKPTPEPTRLRIDGTWLVREVDEHTCGAGPGSGYGCEPGCGLIPEVDLSTLPGYAELLERAPRGEERPEPEPDWSALAPRAQEWRPCGSCGQVHPFDFCEAGAPVVERSLGSTFPTEELAPSTLDRLQVQWSADLHAQVDAGLEAAVARDTWRPSDSLDALLATTCTDCGYHHGAHAVGCPNRRTGP